VKWSLLDYIWYTPRYISNKKGKGVAGETAQDNTRKIKQVHK